MNRRDLFKSTIGLLALAGAMGASSAIAATRDVVENKIARIDALIDKQNKMAGYIDFYVYTRGAVPSNVSALVSAGLLSADLAADFGGTFSVSNNVVEIRNVLPKSKQYEIDYYKANFGGAYSIHAASLNTGNGNGTFSAQYPLTKEAVRSLTMKSKGYIVSIGVPNASANDGRLWYDPLSHAVSISKGGRWVPLSNIKNFYVVRDEAELPSSAVNGDLAVVVSPSKFVKYILVEGIWQPVPQHIPFSYNGQW